MLIFLFLVGGLEPTVARLGVYSEVPAKVQANQILMAIVHQLGEPFLGAVPTVLLILVFYFIMKSLFFKPLLAVMAERELRSIGAEGC
jgi:hypothetical protein